VIEMPRLAVFVGTRPEIIKMAAIIKEAPKYFELHLVHTGQHTDWKMSSAIIQELHLPEPERYLHVGSGPSQFPNVIERAARVLRTLRPEIVLVEGDTNSSAGVAIAARKLRFTLGHVEAGCRSYEPNMQEEINRVLIADCARLHFAATRRCVQNLRREGIDKRAIFLTGHPVVRTIREMVKISKHSQTLDTVALEEKSYAFLTTHREENVDNPSVLRSILAGVSRTGITTLFPVHPRTLKRLRRYGLLKKRKGGNIKFISPVSFVESLSLIHSALIVFTDSGGVQQEAAILGTPCVTLRTRTEWQETVESGINFLAGQDAGTIAALASTIQSNYLEIKAKFPRLRNMFGTSEAPGVILRICKRFCSRTTPWQ
jgi:UDP-N-acetylglucosamine 2-epimerase (non-hydrolysing)